MIWGEEFFEATKSSIQKIEIHEYENMYRAVSELDVTIGNITSKPPINDNDLFICVNRPKK